MLEGIVDKPMWSPYLLLVFAEATEMAGILYMKPTISERFVTGFFNYFPVTETSPCKLVWN